MSVVHQSKLIGAATGNFVNDLTSVGGWPLQQDIQRISEIVVHHGEIIDGLEIQYVTRYGGGHSTHGGQGGSQTVVHLEIGESIVGVYGRYENPGKPKYGQQTISEISFVIANSTQNTGRGVVRVAGPFGQPAPRSNLKQYSVTGSITAFGSYSGPLPYLHGLTFFKVSSEDPFANELNIINL